MLEGRHDLAVLWDIRVAPSSRRRGVGAALFCAATEWAAATGYQELKVETQNVNVAACRFYGRHGCELCEQRRWLCDAAPPRSAVDRTSGCVNSGEWWQRIWGRSSGARPCGSDQSPRLPSLGGILLREMRNASGAVVLAVGPRNVRTARCGAGRVFAAAASGLAVWPDCVRPSGILPWSGREHARR